MSKIISLRSDNELEKIIQDLKEFWHQDGFPDYTTSEILRWCIWLTWKNKEKLTKWILEIVYITKSVIF